MVFISYFFLPVSLEDSTDRDINNPKSRQLENPIIRRLEYSKTRIIDLSKKEKWENPTIRQHFPISYFSFFISHLPTSCDSSRIVVPVI